MSKIAKVGIDVSMNSTGIAIIVPREDQEPKNIFVIVTPHEVKHSGDIVNKVYKRLYMTKKDDDYTYTKEDLYKIISSVNLSTKISQILKQTAKLYKLDGYEARQEGSIMSTGFKKQQSRVNDLTVFNAEVKKMLLGHPLVKSIGILSPGTVKKSFTGKGNCSKDRMLERFAEIFPKFEWKGKCDDVVDAYALASAPMKDSDLLIKKS